MVRIHVRPMARGLAVATASLGALAQVGCAAEVDGVTYYGWLGDDPTSQTFGMRLPDGRYLQFQAITPDLSVGSGYAVRLMLGITVTAQARAGVG